MDGSLPLISYALQEDEVGGGGSWGGCPQLAGLIFQFQEGGNGKWVGLAVVASSRVGTFLECRELRSLKGRRRKQNYDHRCRRCKSRST